MAAVRRRGSDIAGSSTHGKLVIGPTYHVPSVAPPPPLALCSSAGIYPLERCDFGSRWIAFERVRIGADREDLAAAHWEDLVADGLR